MSRLKSILWTVVSWGLIVGTAFNAFRWAVLILVSREGVLLVEPNVYIALTEAIAQWFVLLIVWIKFFREFLMVKSAR